MSFIVDFITGRRDARNTRETADLDRELTTRIYDESIERGQPFLDAGVGAIGSQSNALGLNGQEGFDQVVSDFRASPFATLPFDEGAATLETSAANRGDLLSGQTGKDLVNFGQNKVNNNFTRFFNALSGVSGAGQIAVGAGDAAGSRFDNASRASSALHLQGQNQGTSAIREGFSGLTGALASIFGAG
ncbi:MAG: hypothetical protein COB36_11620 [Alphaproteobacteria bacterium]|nr:MAG: hypothetical protein COB36_11620 [Alphaproteobacteria bacterium]